VCGIFGAIGDATDEALSAACVALAHRGPDSAGAWRDGAIGLAHTRLKVIDLSEAAAQPMVGCERAIQLTFNGEVYNHRELRRELEQEGHKFNSRSDVEVVVHGYEQWGVEVVERLDGMFAFGLWDGRTRRLLLARDRSGKKPLFYTCDGRSLRFASELKALVAAGHPDGLDPAALPMFLSWGYVPDPATLHRGVLTVPPASRLVWEPGRGAAPRVDRYWSPTFLEPPLQVGEDEARGRIRELVIAAVARRLEADVPLGAFLSAGIDSTIVVGVMARLLGRRVHTFSIGFPEHPAFDESAPARETARFFDTQHTEFQMQRVSPEVVEKLVWLHDGPFADSSAIPTFTVSQLTRRHVTVALSGDGGDELFAGYLRFLAAEAAEHIPSLVRRAANLAGRLLPRGLPPHSLGARARRFFDQAARPLAERIAAWNSQFAFELADLIRPELADTLDLAGPMDWQRSFFEGPNEPLALLLEHNFRTYLPCDLHVKVDRCSAGQGLEVRAPFLDTALMEYAGRLPNRLRRRGTRTKYVLRAAFADLIPPHIARRPKRGFGVPLDAWFRGDLRPLLADRLGGSARLNEYLRPEAVARLLAEHLGGRADHSERLWTLLSLEVWLGQLASAAPRARDLVDARHEAL
jgi:asparagine synthase (glutamine-hydrolysing)